jgi:hypothetical protein
MRFITIVLGIVLIFLMVGAVSAANVNPQATITSGSGSSSSSSSTLSGTSITAQLSVTSVTLDPQVFFYGDTGTITVVVTNTGSQSVTLESADILDPQNVIRVVNEQKNPYNSWIYLGPGNTMTYSFLVIAVGPDGTYFPTFTAPTDQASSIRYAIPVQVDSTPITATIGLQPTNFVLNSTSDVNVTIINPRQGAISNVIITPQGAGLTITPSIAFIPTIAGGSSVDTTFAVTPAVAGNVTFNVTYYNGALNKYATSVVLPINLGTTTTAANPVINDVAVTNDGSTYTLTGDVTNDGVTDATGLILYPLSPAQSVQPYANFPVGSLASDDFSSFTLTFTANDLSAIPIEIDWKDANGNALSTVQTLDLRPLVSGSTSGSRSSSYSSSSSSTGTTTGGSAASTAGGGYGGARPGGGGGLGGIFGGGRGGGLSAFYPLIAGAIVVIAGIVLYTKRKQIAARLKKKQ